MPETPSESENVPLDERPMQIPPAFEVFVNRLKADKKKLMKDKAFGQTAEQLRGFIGTYLYPRFTELVRLFASGIFETYSLAASNAESLRRLHEFVIEELEQVRGELDDLDSDRRGVNPAVLDEFQQAFYALGSVLREKLPKDKETEEAYNVCVELLAGIVADLMGSDYDDGDDDGDDDDGENADDDDADEKVDEKVDESNKTPASSASADDKDD